MHPWLVGPGSVDFVKSLECFQDVQIAEATLALVVVHCETWMERIYKRAEPTSQWKWILVHFAHSNAGDEAESCGIRALIATEHYLRLFSSIMFLNTP